MNGVAQDLTYGVALADLARQIAAAKAIGAVNLATAYQSQFDEAQLLVAADIAAGYTIEAIGNGAAELVAAQTAAFNSTSAADRLRRSS